MMMKAYRAARVLAGGLTGSLLMITAQTALAADDAPPYQVVEGYKVDPDTMQGFRTWRTANCSMCHGANQEGAVGPSLVNSLKVLSKQEFTDTVIKGRLDKGMPSFGQNKSVTEHIDKLYAYLKGRSDGAITRARVEENK